jgi:hypothetical protein
MGHQTTPVDLNLSALMKKEPPLDENHGRLEEFL